MSQDLLNQIKEANKTQLLALAVANGIDVDEAAKVDAIRATLTEAIQSRSDEPEVNVPDGKIRYIKNAKTGAVFVATPLLENRLKVERHFEYCDKSEYEAQVNPKNSVTLEA